MQRLRLVAAFLFCVANVHAIYSEDFVTMGVIVRRMTSVNGSECGADYNQDAAVVCDGGLERELRPGNMPTNVIPQVQNVIFKYEGAMPAQAYFSLIDAQFDCDSYVHSPTPNNINSGIQQADEQKVVTIPQRQSNGDEELLSSTQNGQEQMFKLCYSCNNLTTTDCTNGIYDWRDSGIQLHVSRLESITAYNVAHKTEGTIPNHNNLHILYTGPLANERWISFVDASLNNNRPCDSGEEAAAAEDSSHSGSLAAGQGTKEFTFKSNQLSASIQFAVCYAESGGIKSSMWRDSGIRVRRSAVTAVKYGVDSKFGVGFERLIWNRYNNRADNAAIDISTDRFPRVEDAMLQVVGDLVSANMQLSIVDAGLMDSNPCMYAQLTTADPAIYNYRSQHPASGSLSQGKSWGPNRRHLTGAASSDANGFVVFPQTDGNLLDHDSALCGSTTCVYDGNVGGTIENTYALCYSTGTDISTLTTNNQGWTDTYIRFKITDIESIQHHGVQHATDGQLPRSTVTGTAGPGAIRLEFGASNDESASAVPHTGFAPGSTPREENALYFTRDADYTPANEASSNPCASLDKTLPPTSANEFESGYIVPENSANNTFFPLATDLMNTGNIDPGTNALTKTYFAVCYSRDFSNYNGARTFTMWFDTGIRVTVSKISRIEYGNVHGSAHYTQSSLYEKRKFFPHWQPETSDGSTFVSDYASWYGAIHKPNYDNGQARAHNVISQDLNQQIEYVSTAPSTEQLGNNAWIALVDATLNGGTDSSGRHWSKPCAYTEAPNDADASHSGVMQAGTGDTLVTVLQNIPLSETKLFAVCYAVQTGTSSDQSWDDSYIRLTVSMVTQISSLGVVHEVSNDDKYVNSIAHRGAAMLDITYSGKLSAGSRISLINEVLESSDLRAGNTRACQEYAAQAPGGEASGALSTTNTVTGQADLTSKTVRLQTSTLYYDITFAVCYEVGNSWYDTGIRLRRTEFSSARFYNMYEAPAAREQTSIFRDSNRLPGVASQALKYIADVVPLFDLHGYTPTPGGRYVSLVAVQQNGMNPCAAGTLTAMSSLTLAAGPLGARLVSTVMKATQDVSPHCTSMSSTPRECGDFTVSQSDSDAILDSASTFALCYCNDCDGSSDNNKLWWDSYIRLGISQIASISQNFGRWGSDAGTTIKHIASGQIPNMSPAIENLGLSTEGAANQGLAITYEGSGLSIEPQFVLVEQNINPEQEHGIYYYRPCRDQSFWTDSSLYTSPVAGTGSSSTGNVTTLDTTSLNTDRVYALCYSPNGDNSFDDSGIRLTVPKLINVQHSSFHSGISPRSQTAVFRTTNRLSQSDGSSTPLVQLKYLGPVSGALPAQKYVQLIKVEDSSDAVRNPCVNSVLLLDAPSSSNSGPLTANANYIIELPGIELEHSGVFAVCYSDGATVGSGLSPVHQYEVDGITPLMVYQNNNWRDSMIRLQVTKVTALKAADIITTTDGQIPNTHVGMYFEYIGLLEAERYISFVHDKSRTVDGYYEPCSTESSTMSADHTHTGSKQATTDSIVNTLDTTELWTNITFALCYSDVADGASGYEDSGIRVTLPKVYSLEASSQYIGGSDDCYFHGGDPAEIPYIGLSRYSGNCKTDTMARQQTSMPISTNRLAQDGTPETLRYVGDLAGGGQIAIVDAAVNANAGWSGSLSAHDPLLGSSPCVDYTTSSSVNGFQVESDVLVADQDKQVILGSDVEFAEGVTAAVCYYDPAATTPSKWRDSLIRLQVSRVGAIDLQIPTLQFGTISGETSYTNITLKTVGQLPRQKPNTQVVYKYSGTVSTDGDYRLALSEDLQDVHTRSFGQVQTRDGTTGFRQDINTTMGFNIHQPCENPDLHSGSRTDTVQQFAPASNFQTQSVDTFSANVNANPGTDNYIDGATGPALKSHDGAHSNDPEGDPALALNPPTPISYAVCYNSTNGWADSGIRVTISQLDAIHYRDGHAGRMYESQRSISDIRSTTDGQYNVMIDHTTYMSSAYSASNQIPQLPPSSGTTLTMGRWVNTQSTDAYIVTDLSGGRFSSLVDASLNNYNPCVHPSEAAHAFDSQHSGPMEMGSYATGDTYYKRSVTLAQLSDPTKRLDSSATFAVCYSDSTDSTKGTVTDPKWRDSYIRITISQVESIHSYQVNHQTVGGQIPNNAGLKINYIGSLQASSVISLVETQYAGSYISSLQDHFPCAHSSVASGIAGSQRSGISTAGIVSSSVANSHVVVLDTTGLNTTIAFAVCYSDIHTPSIFHDSGIRVTLPKIYKFSYQSRYWSEALSEGTPNRVFSSFAQEDGLTLIDTPTNRLPRSQTIGSLLSFVDGVHSSASNVIVGTERISIVKVSVDINNYDACTDPDIASPSYGVSDERNLLYGSLNSETTPSGVKVNGVDELEVDDYMAVLTMEQKLLDSTPSTPDEVYALCYTDGGGGANDKYWRDTYVRLKLTLVNSLIVANVRHFTSGHIPVTAAADGMKFHYDVDGTLGNGGTISLVDSSLSSGLPCADARFPSHGSDSSLDDNWFSIKGIIQFGYQALNPQADNPQPHLKHWADNSAYSGPHEAEDNVAYVQGLDTRFLSKTIEFAVCYGASRSAAQWYDSGIRLTVSRVAALEYAACNDCGTIDRHMCKYVDPTDPNVKATCDTDSDGVFDDLCMTRSLCDPQSPYNGGCGTETGAKCEVKGDTAPRTITTATKALNKLPSITNLTFTVVGDLPVNSHFSLVRFDAYISDAYQRFAQTDTNGLPVQGSYNPCIFNSIASASSTDVVPPAGTPGWDSIVANTPDLAGTANDQRAYSGVVTANGMRVTIPQISDGSSGVHDRLDARLGIMFAMCYNPDPSMASNQWQDSYLRVKMSRIESIEVVTPSVLVGSGNNDASVSNTRILTQGQLNNQANYSNTQQATIKIKGHSTLVYGGSSGAQLPSKLAFVWLRPEEEMSIEARTVDSQLNDASGTKGDWGMNYLDPCAHWGDTDQITSVSLAPETRSNALLLETTVVDGRNVESPLGIFDLSSLDSTKTYAVCYADINLPDWRDGKFSDSGIRVTLPRVTQLDYQGTPEDAGRKERTRTMSTWLLATNVLPQLSTVQLKYFHSTDSTRGLNSGQWIAVVDAAQGTDGNPCANYATVEAVGSTSTGATQSPQVLCTTDSDCINVHNTSMCDLSTLVCTGGVIDLPQNVLLDENNLYAVCYAESTAGVPSIIDFTSWKDSYIRLTISQIPTITSFLVTHETTGQLANHRALPVSFSSTASLLNAMILVKNDQSSTAVPSLHTHYPCNYLSAANLASIHQTEHVIATLGTSGATQNGQAEIDTRYLKTFTDDGGTTADPVQCWNNHEKHCIGSTNWGHEAYALCYQWGSNFADTGVRLTVSQIATLKLDSGYTAVPNRFITSAPLAINTFPIDGNGDTKVYWMRDQGTSGAFTDPLPLTIPGLAQTHFSLVSTALDLDPCAKPALASCATCATPECATCIRNYATSNNLATDHFVEFDKDKTKYLAQEAHPFAVCYTGSNGDAYDYGWRDTYIRLTISKIRTFSAVSVTHTTFGQIPSVQAGEQMKFSWEGALDSLVDYISLVDAGLNSNHPCAAAHASQAADARHSGPAKATGVGYTDSLTTSGLYLYQDLTLSPVKDSMDESEDVDQYYDQDSHYQEDYYLALCFSSDYIDSGNPGSWHDSGIRLTTPSLTQLELPSQYAGTASRVFTSYEVPTNKIPSGDLEFSLIYSAPNSVNPGAALGAGAYISLVATEGSSVMNQANPCVFPTDATLPYSSQSSGAGVASLMSGRNGRTFTQTNFSRYQGKPGSDIVFTFAVCYTGNSQYGSNAGDSGDVGWRDSYIRLTVSDVEWFGTKGIRHRTTGQIPYHKAGLIFEASQQSWSISYISLVDETMNPGSNNAHFTDAFSEPCLSPSASVHAVDNSNTANTLSTMDLSTSKTYALCYYVGGDYTSSDGLTRETSWGDSGIRLTVSALWGIQYSGYTRQITESRGQRWRTITSTVAELQPAGAGMTNELASHVLPKKPGNMELVYIGDLPVSQMISIVQWTDPCTSNSDDLTDSSSNKGECSSYVQADSSNPCVNTATATAFWSGQACYSYEQGWVGHSRMSRCDYYTGATVSGNNEFTFDSSSSLQSGGTYTFCYSSDQGSTWYDSYIRFTASDIDTFSAPQLNPSPSFHDHGHIGRYENAVQLDLQYAGSASSAGAWIALVDETITASQHPCTGGAFWEPAGKRPTATLTTRFSGGVHDKHYIVGNKAWGQQTFTFTTLVGSSPTSSVTITGRSSGATFVWKGYGSSPATQMKVTVRSSISAIEGEMITIDDNTWNATLNGVSSIVVGEIRGVSTQASDIDHSTETMVLAQESGAFGIAEYVTSQVRGGTYSSSGSPSGWTDQTEWFDALVTSTDNRFNSSLIGQDYTSASSSSVSGYTKKGSSGICASPSGASTIESTKIEEAGPLWETARGIAACQEHCNYFSKCVAFAWREDFYCVTYLACDAFESAIMSSQNHVFMKDAVMSPELNTYVGARALDSTQTVQIETEHMDVGKQYVACYKSASSSAWADSGLRFTLSKLHSIEYNMGQTPTNQFRTVFGTSRSKVGLPRCVTIGLNPEATCGLFLNETCEIGSLCDPDLPPIDTDEDGLLAVSENRNGGCGNYKLDYGTGNDLNALGQCTSALKPANYVCLGNVISPLHTCDNNFDGIFDEECANPIHVTCQSNADCHGLDSSSHCLVSNGVSGRCMQGDQLLVQYSRCNPDNEDNGGCGTVGVTCSIVHSATVYNHPQKHILHKTPASPTELLALGDGLSSDIGTSLVLIESSENNGEPCLHAASSTSSRLTLSDVGSHNNQVQLFSDNFLAGTEYTVCYNSTGVGVGAPAADTWFDSYIRFQFSEVATVSHHGAQAHSTQGHIAATTHFGLTYSGSLEAGAYLALVDENQAQPCSGTPVAIGIFDVTNGAQPTTGTSTKQVSFDTSNLDTRKNFAVCYGRDPSSMTDSGIRVTVAAMHSLIYNYDQYSDYIGEGRYQRTMYSTNMAPDGCQSNTCASDGAPAATNRLPTPGGSRFFEFSATDPLSTKQIMVVVDSSKNNGNPCMDFSDMAQNSSDISSGNVASLGTRRFEIPDSTRLTGSVTKYTTCYCNLVNHMGENVVDYTTCRDSYIQMEPTLIQTLTAYGQKHTTTGRVASRSALGIMVDGNLTDSTLFPDVSTALLAMIDEKENGYHPCASVASKLLESASAVYSGTSTGYESPRTFTLSTETLGPQHTFSMCYSTDSGTTFQDSGHRLTVPQIVDITYSAPVRKLQASTCFASASPFLPGGIANCYPDPSRPSNRNSQLPQSHNVLFNYNGHLELGTLSDGYKIRLVDHELGYNDPCSTGADANGTIDRRQSSGVIDTQVGRSAILNLTEGNLLDYSKTFAVCYSATAADLSLYEDSFIRVTWSHVHTLRISGDSFAVTTKGLIAGVPQMRIEWAHSTLSMPEGDNTNHYSPWLRLTAEDQNSGFPCEQDNADQAVGANSTQKQQVLASANEFVVVDTSILGEYTGVNSFAVCVAIGDGSSSDSSWEHSGITVRVVKWTNSAKSRVVAGAPSLFYFVMNTGDFVTTNGKVALVAYDNLGQATQGCETAKDSLLNSNPYFSTGNAVMRQIDYRCKSIGSSPDNTCDTGGQFHAMDENFNNRCILGARCTPRGDNAGGCGSIGGGECSAAVQLPTGKAYTGLRSSHVGGVWQDDTEIEPELQTGSYSMCICDDSNGDGGCDDVNEWTVMFNSNYAVPDPINPGTSYGGNIHVVSRPRIGRDGTFGPLRHLQNQSHQYHIRASNAMTGYEVQDNDQLYFAPANEGCGQVTTRAGLPASWRTMPTTICTSVGGSGIQATCDVDQDGRYDETCVVKALCDDWSTAGHGCGSSGVCETPRVTVDTYEQTAPILVANLTGQIATFTTPSVIFLEKAQSMVACYATRQSFYSNDPNVQTESGDYAELDDMLEVVATPQVGPSESSRFHVNDQVYHSDMSTHIRALENSSPKFHVSTFSEGDLMYFMPRTPPPLDDADDCTPFMCTSVGGSLVGSNCDDDYNNIFSDQCVTSAACNPSNANNGGCGVAGVCERAIPEVNHASFTMPTQGTDFTEVGGFIQLPTDVLLTTSGAATDTSCTSGLGSSMGGTYGDTPSCQPGSAKYFVTCFIPRGAIVQLSNVHRLQEDLTIFKEPTDALVTSHFEGRVYRLDFTSPQQGDYNRPQDKEFSTGLPGDCVVLTQATTCADAYQVNQEDYFVGLGVNIVTGAYEEQHRSTKMILTEADKDTTVTGDVKGGVASYQALAQGKVNELPPGIYKICYATMNSECDQTEDFKMLTKEIEILPPDQTAATLKVHVTVQLGHDILVEWSSNSGLSPQDMIGETWVGLYDKDACLDTYPQTLRHKCQPVGGREQPIAYRTLETVKMLGGYCETDEQCHPAEWREKCSRHHDPTDLACSEPSHLSMCYKNKCTGGIDNGEIRFSYSEYLRAGDYDVRLFQGDARNKNGIFCGGMTGTPHETYTQCTYESTVGATLKVYNNRDMLEDLEHLPGFEVSFNGNKGTFRNKYAEMDPALSTP